MHNAIDSDFTHLRVHSTYSLLEATAKIEDLVRKAVSEKFKRLALTDTNALYGAVVFAKACERAGIQPITGMTLNVDSFGVAMPGEETRAGQLVLLATGPDGYRSLCKLTSLLQGTSNREHHLAQGLSWDDLRAHRKGLICLSGGRRGWLVRFLQTEQRKNAQHYAGRLAEIFGEHAFLSLEIRAPSDSALSQQIVEIGAGLGMRIIALQPIKATEVNDQSRLKLLAAIDQNCSLRDLEEKSLPDLATSLHWLSTAEVGRKFRQFPEALANVGWVAKRCQPALPSGEPIWPVLKLPAGMNAEQVLEKEAYQGLGANFGLDVVQSVRQRMQYELATIFQHGYAPLFLIVADIVRFAKEVDLPVSTRGSVANSLVAYCIGISMVDPVAHDLLFERFLNPARGDLPDIDLDFGSRRRDEVLDYVRRTYGEEKVALVATMNTLRPRSAVRETAKAYGLSESEVSQLARRVPRGRRQEVTIEDLMKQVHKPRWREVLKAAFSIVGQPHHLSLHPGGIVITPTQLTDIVPVQWSSKGFLMTQYDHRDVEAIGLPKLDLLGIRALTVLSDAAALVRKHHLPEFRLEHIPYDDQKAGDLLAQGQSIGVFQCESTGAIRTLRRLGARSIRDLAVANAFFRPGPMMGGMAKTFVRRFRGEEQVEHVHPSLEPILGITRGVIIFQEQILRIAREIAGLTWEQADQLRRGIGRLSSNAMQDVEDVFIEGCQKGKPQLSRDQANKLWEHVRDFSGFGFNQGHATAYAHVSYRSAYMKAHWPAAFLCARLADHGGYHHPAVYIAEAIRLGISVRPPHVNVSTATFALSWEDQKAQEKPTLWMGLQQVRDLRRSTISEIVGARKQRPFKDLRDLMQRVNLQTKEIMHLIQCGGLDRLGGERASLLAEAQQIKAADSEQQMAFSFAAPMVSHATRLQSMHWEITILGQPLSVHPLDLVQYPSDQVSLEELPNYHETKIATMGVRLPGRTGGDGFFLGDQNTFINAVWDGVGSLPKPWTPIQARGSWIGDGMGSYWFQIDGIRVLPLSSR